MLLIEGLVNHIEPFSFSFFGVSGWGIDLDYCDVEWFALKMNQIILSFWGFVSDSFVDCDGYSISFRGFLPTVVDIMVI